MKLLGCLILSMFLCNTAIAQDKGRFTFLGEGECAPFEGTLFDIDATAEVVTLKKLRTDLQLEIDNQKIHYESMIQGKDLIIQSQIEQIDQMETAIKTLAPNNKWLWFAGGVVGGIALSYGAYEVYN